MATLKKSELKDLIADLIPDMEARVKGLQALWPGREILTCLHRNEALLHKMKAVTKE